MINLFGKKEPPVRVPKVGEEVWWAPKGVEGVVTSVLPNSFSFSAGEYIKKGGATMQRWTVAASLDAGVWDEELKTWIIGKGINPKVLRGIVVKPEPVVILGKS